MCTGLPLSYKLKTEQKFSGLTTLDINDFRRCFRRILLMTES